MDVPFYTSTREYLQHKNEFDTAVQDVMERGDFILGKDVKEFENLAVQHCGCAYAAGVASGTDALVLGSDILGFKDSEVLTPVFTFFASVSCIVRVGGKPVFVDIDEQTLTINLKDAEKRITKKTKGIIPVHLFLQAADMQAVMDLARLYDVTVLEDAAEAWGMECFVDNIWKKAGTVGAIGIFSFFPTKTLGAYGDAGLMVTNDEQLYQKIKSYRVHGAGKKYFHDYIGYNSRIDTIQAAILKVKLNYIEKSMQLREKHAMHYIERLSHAQEIVFPGVLLSNKPVYYVFNILVPKRDELVAYLREHGIQTSIYYPLPMHMQKCFQYLGYKKGDFPVAEKVSQEIVALPMFAELTDDEVDYVCDTIISFYRR
jgi:dTDP-4-amino-4,6-dideoxygalactose transaminase